MLKSLPRVETVRAARQRRSSGCSVAGSMWFLCPANLQVTSLMKSKTKSPKKTNRPRNVRRATRRANETVALFLGPKLLGELRILMRIASPTSGVTGPIAEAA